MSDIGAYRIVGKLLWVGLDSEGNLRIILKNGSRFWAEATVRYLSEMQGSVIKLNVDEWRSHGTFNPLKNPHKSHFTR
ncbi:MAG: hypothetical protein QXF26_09170 [Candidatus Bathyarchaeia archaeon]